MINTKLVMENVKPIQVRIYDDLVTLSEDTIIKTRLQKIQNCKGCIDEVLSGKVYLNPEYGIERYTQEMQNEACDIAKGKHDHYLAFIQTAYYIQSGECVPVLSK